MELSDQRIYVSLRKAYKDIMLDIITYIVFCWIEKVHSTDVWEVTSDCFCSKFSFLVAGRGN